MTPHPHPLTKTARWWWALFLTSAAVAVVTVGAKAEDLSYMGSMDRFWRHHVETKTLEHEGVNYYPLIQSCLMEKLSPEEWEAIPNIRSKSRAVGKKVMLKSSSPSDSSDSDDDKWAWTSAAVLVGVEKAIHPAHAKAVQALAACAREHMPFLYESRAMYKELSLKEDPGLGGNCPTHIAPLVAIFLPAVRQEMQRTLEVAFNAGGWKEWAEEDALYEVDSSHKEYMPNLDYIGIRASEHLTYTDFPLLSPHNDGQETKFTMNFAFSGPDDYEGGEFYIQNNDQEHTYLKPNKYDAMVFLGGVYGHGVTEITGGHREMFSTEFWNYPDIPFGGTLWTSLSVNMEKHIRQCNEWEAEAEDNVGPCMLPYPNVSGRGYHGFGNLASEYQYQPQKGEEDEDSDGKEDGSDPSVFFINFNDEFNPFKFNSYRKMSFRRALWLLTNFICFCASAWLLLTTLKETTPPTQSSTNISESHLLRILKPNRIRNTAATIISSWYRGTSFRLRHRGSASGLSNSRSVLRTDRADHHKRTTSDSSHDEHSKKRDGPGMLVKCLSVLICFSVGVVYKLIVSAEPTEPTGRLRHRFECHKAFESTRPWWTNDQFREVRELYRDFAQVNKPSKWPTKVRTFMNWKPYGTYQASDDTLFDSSQLAVPYQADKEKGRGLKAARDIKEGEIILKPTNNTIVFLDGQTYNKFLIALNERFPTFACDIETWAWVQDLDEEGVTFGASVDLNNNNLLNSVYTDDDIANVQCGKPGEEEIEEARCDMTFYAKRDIRKGEELMGSYGEFVSSHYWNELGL